MSSHTRTNEEQVTTRKPFDLFRQLDGISSDDFNLAGRQQLLRSSPITIQMTVQLAVL